MFLLEQILNGMPPKDRGRGGKRGSGSRHGTPSSAAKPSDDEIYEEDVESTKDAEILRLRQELASTRAQLDQDMAGTPVTPGRGAHLGGLRARGAHSGGFERLPSWSLPIPRWQVSPGSSRWRPHADRVCYVQPLECRQHRQRRGSSFLAHFKPCQRQVHEWSQRSWVRCAYVCLVPYASICVANDSRRYASAGAIQPELHGSGEVHRDVGEAQT